MSEAPDHDTEPTGYPPIQWGNNYNGPCAECGGLIEYYESNWQTQDRSAHYHRQCVQVGPMLAKYPNLNYYTDG